jgi:hypothetical protein
MKKLFPFLILITIIIVTNPLNAQLLQQQFTDALTAGNLGGGTVISNAAVLSDPVYVNNPASASQFTFLSTNNDLASIAMSGDGVMRIVRNGSGTVYIVRNTNFTGSPSAVQVKFDFNAETTAGTSGGVLEFMLGQNFANSNNNPAALDKHSVFFVNTKSPTGTPGTWGVTPLSASSASSYNTTETITWVANNGTETISYTAPDGSTESLISEAYDLWVGTAKLYDDQAATTPAAELNNFEIRVAGGTGTYTIDNLVITEVTSGGGSGPLTDHYRTKQSGSWNDFNTWESSADGVTWVNAVVTPYDTSNTITIKTGDTVSVTESVAVDQFTIEAGGVLIVEGTPVVFTINDGPDDVDMTVHGYIKATGTANSSPGPYSVNAEGEVHFESGSTYDHNQNIGAIPVSTWKPGSTVKFTGVTSSAPANRSQNFSNIVYDCPNQTANLNMGFTNAEISGDIVITNTGTGRWQLCAPAAGDSAYINIHGDIIQIAGNFTSHGTSNGTTTIEIHTRGNITTTAGNFSITRGSQGGTGTTTWYIHGNLSMTNTATQNSNSAGAKFVFPAGYHHLNLENVTFTGGLPIEAADSADLDMHSSIVRGSGIFKLNGTASLYTANPGGLDSALQNTGALSLSTDGGYNFNGTVEQITGTKLPPEVRALAVNNNAGVILSDTVKVNSLAGIMLGDLNLNGNVLDLGNTGSLNESAGRVKGAGKIVAARELNAPAGSDPIGIGAWIHSSANLGMTTIERYNSFASGNSNTGVSRIFNITPANNTNLNATLFFYYKEAELNAIPEANLRLFSSPDGSNNSWSLRNGSVNAADNYVELSGINSFAYWTLADINAPIPVELTSFEASLDEYSVILSWRTATENQNKGWNIERKPAEGETWMNIGFVEGNGTSTQPLSYRFRDADALEGIYQYRLRQLDYNGEYSVSQVVEIEVSNMPSVYSLNQNFPNPFNPETVIRFELPEEAFINLTVYNAIGEKIAVLVNEKMEKGRYSRSFNASDLPSGIYIYRLISDNSVLTKKMMLLK